MAIQYGGLSIEWLGYATVRIEGEKTTIYLDPGRYGVLTGEWEPDTENGTAHPPGKDFRPKDGDFICITHTHHYDADGIERVLDDDGTVVAFDGIDPRESSRELPRLVELPYDVVEVGMEEETLIEETPIWTVPAYNEAGGPHTTEDGTPFHPKGRGCGYLLSVDGTRIFWPGDTDVLDGHDQLDVDILLPPIGGAFTMDRKEAAKLAASMGPALVVPIHYNTFEALETNSREFAADVASEGIAVALDEK